jgi:hypothetical protein
MGSESRCGGAVLGEEWRSCARSAASGGASGESPSLRRAVRSQMRRGAGGAPGANALHSHEVLCRRLRFRLEGVGEKERSAISSASKSAAAASAPHARLAAICGHVQDNVSALKELWRGDMRLQATELSVETQPSVA